MRYVELKAVVPVAQAERVADILRDVTRGGVALETPFTQADVESEAVLASTGPTTVCTYLPGDTDRGDLVLDIRRRLDAEDIECELNLKIVAEEDWAEAWKEHFQVERYGQRIVVVPSWRKYEPQPGDALLTLDPGMAFGTGQHQTTRMCLESLERVVHPGARVLDVGCGSGILAIAAAKLGAAEVHALDIDPVCIEVATANAALNGVNVRVALGSVGAHWPFASKESYDILVANIIAGALIEMAHDLAGVIASRGTLIASGVIEHREPEVIEAFRNAGFATEKVRAMGEWRCIEAVRT